MQIGPHVLPNRLILAPMAGVTDRPFRQLCRAYGVGLAVSEMIGSQLALRDTRKSRLRMNHEGEAGLRSVQIVGADPVQMAAAARFNVEHGAQIIDINMGCPAKKVCNRAAGSALMREPGTIRAILAAVVQAVEVPVTLKIRTGWCPDSRNAVEIATIAEQEGIAALAIHGRTRACRFAGLAEYDTIARVKSAVRIPIIANGDIDSPAKAIDVLRRTGADALMVGRAAQGRPWLLGQILAALDGRAIPADPDWHEISRICDAHLRALYAFYGLRQGVLIARKHIGWTLGQIAGGSALKPMFFAMTDVQGQSTFVRRLPTLLKNPTKEKAE